MMINIVLFFVLLIFSLAAATMDNLFQENLKKVQQCIHLSSVRHSKVGFPADAEEHHKFLLKKTEKFRNVPPQNNEPYIEKMFIDRFIDKPVTSFGGMIPLFIQWSDYQLSHRHLSTKADDYAMFHEILPYLRSDVVYMVVSQANYGIKMFFHLPNVLVFSAGGVGHVPIPLVKGHLNYTTVDVTTNQYNLLGFFGSIDHGARKMLIKALQHVVRENRELVTAAKSENTVHHLVIKKTPDWVHEMQMTLFNVAPVGFGRGSYRLSEVVRIGRIPVFLYADYPWLPYEGTVMSPASLGLMSDAAGMDRLYKKMNFLLANAKHIEEYLVKVKQAYRWYTNEGIVEQIELFFTAPFEAGFIRCSSHYQRFKDAKSRDPWYLLTHIFSSD